MKIYSVYILERQKNGEFYIGITRDVNDRLRQHNKGGVGATKNKKPYRMVFSQEFNSRKMAQEIERKIKRWKRRDFIEKIVKDGYVKER